uniref:hypothetical protein n=1 Tax=Salmonella enterica TaxID=28901 RepID=UPI0020C3ABB5
FPSANFHFVSHLCSFANRLNILQMVRTRQHLDEDDDAPNMDAAIANALNSLFPGLTTPEMMEQVINNIRNQTGEPSGSGGGAQPV